MWGTKLAWTGLGLLFAVPKFWSPVGLEWVAAFVLILGIVLMWFNK